MVKISSFSVFGFTILCFACVLNALEDDLQPNNDGPSKDLADSPSASIYNPSYRRSTNPSAWSKEEKDDLKSSGNENMRDEWQYMPFFHEESNQWNMKNFFRYFTYLLYGMNENNDDSFDTSTDMQNSMNNNFADKSNNNMQTEKTNSGNEDAMNRSEDDANVQNPETGTSNEPKNREKTQNFGSTDSQINSDDGKEQKLSNNPSSWSNKEKDHFKSGNYRNMRNRKEDMLFFDEESSLWNMKKFYQYFKYLLYTINKNNGGSSDISTGNEKIEMQKSITNKPENKSENKVETETPNSANGDTLNKPEDNENVQKPGTDTMSKPNDDKNVQNSGSTDRPSNSDDETEGTTNISNKSNDSTGVEDSANRDRLTNSSDGGKLQNVSNNDSINKREPSSNFKTKAQDSMDKDAVDKSEKSVKADKQNLENIDTSNKPKEDFTRSTTKDYEICNADEIDDVSDEESNGYKVENDNDVEKKYDLHEKDLYEDETEDEYDTDDDYEDETEDDYVQEINSDNENDANPNGIENENINENSYDNDGNKFVKASQNMQATNASDETAPNSSFTLPKFLIKVIQGPQNYSTAQQSKKQNNNDDGATPEVTESENLTNQEKILQEFQLNSNEFIDTYINNPANESMNIKSKESSNTESLTPNQNNSKSEEIPYQIPMIENNDENNKSLNNSSPTNENTEDRPIPYNNSQNTDRNFTLENNALPLPIDSSGKSYTIPNKGPLNENSLPENIQNAAASDIVPISSFPEDSKTNEIKPLNLISINEIPYLTNSGTPQEYYNTFAEPVITDFQNNQSSPEVFHNNVPISNEYKPQVMNSPPMTPNESIPIQNEAYLIHQYSSNNFQNANTPGMIDEFDKIQKTTSEQDQIYELKLLNQINNENNYEILNQQTESTNQPFQEKLTEPQQLSPSNDVGETIPQNTINNESNMSSEIFPIQNDANDENSSPSQKGKNSNTLPYHSFDITEDGQEDNKSKSKTSFPVNIIHDKSEEPSQNVPDSSSNDGNSNNSSNPDYDNEGNKKGDEEITVLSDEQNPDENEIEDDFVNENDDESETDDEDETNYKDENEDGDKIEKGNEKEREDENEKEYEQEREDENEKEYEQEREDENEKEYEQEREDENEKEYEQEGEEEMEEVRKESEEKIEDERKEDEEKIEEERKGGEEKIEERKGGEERIEEEERKEDEKKIEEERKRGEEKIEEEERKEENDEQKPENNPNTTIQRISSEQNYPETQPAMYQIDNNDDAIVAAEDDKSQNKINEESPTQIIQENDAPKQQELQSGLPSSNEEKKFDTILEYIYEHSNNPMFTDIKEEQAS